MGDNGCTRWVGGYFGCWCSTVTLLVGWHMVTVVCRARWWKAWVEPWTWFPAMAPRSSSPWNTPPRSVGLHFVVVLTLHHPPLQSVVGGKIGLLIVRDTERPYIKAGLETVTHVSAFNSQKLKGSSEWLTFYSTIELTASVVFTDCTNFLSTTTQDRKKTVG